MSLLKFISIITCTALFVGCSSLGSKENITANVDSDVIEIPTQAAQDFKVAVGFMNQNNHKQALLVLEKLTVEYPQLSGPYANIGVIYAQQKDWPNAEIALKNAVDRNVKNTKARNQLAFVYRNQGKFNDAEAQYLEAINVSPKDSISYLNLGILYDIYMGRLESASGYYQQYQALQKEPDNKVAGWLVDINRRAGIKTQIAGEGN